MEDTKITEQNLTGRQKIEQEQTQNILRKKKR
jgi:hypothetical protein